MISGDLAVIFYFFTFILGLSTISLGILYVLRGSIIMGIIAIGAGFYVIALDVLGAFGI